jgi:hypothetical protein
VSFISRKLKTVDSGHIPPQIIPERPKEIRRGSIVRDEGRSPFLCHPCGLPRRVIIRMFAILLVNLLMLYLAFGTTVLWYDQNQVPGTDGEVTLTR